MNTAPSDPRLHDVNRFNQLCCENKSFLAFARKVYGYLSTMKPGKVMLLKGYEGKKLEWIVLTACAFICEGVHSADYEFTNDYTAIVRRRIPFRIYVEFAAAKGYPIEQLFPKYCALRATKERLRANRERFKERTRRRKPKTPPRPHVYITVNGREPEL